MKPAGPGQSKGGVIKAGTGARTGTGAGARAGARTGTGAGARAGTGAGARAGAGAGAGAGAAKAKPIWPNTRNNAIRKALFVASVDGVGQFPPGPVEVAFTGRSNVGKSSLINGICGHGSLARTSKTPGRTQRVNLFDIEFGNGQLLRLVDLPGFGHAELPRDQRVAMAEMIQLYLLGQERLGLVIILQDSRRDRDEDAIGFAQWLKQNGVAVDVVATKCDQIPRNKLGAVQQRLQREFELPYLPMAVSSKEGMGMEELRMRLRSLADGGKGKPKGPATP